MELTAKELCDLLTSIEHELRDDVRTNLEGRTVLANIMAKCAEIRLRVSRYGVAS